MKNSSKHTGRFIGKIFFLAGIFILPIIALSQKNTDRKITGKLEELISRNFPKIAPGCVVLIAKENKIIYEKAFGLSDRESGVPMSVDHLFRTGSMGKQYTAVAIMQLVESGKIKVWDSIQKYVPDFPSKQYPVTIENLLTNTSGLKNYFEIANPAKERETYTAAQGVDYFKDEPLQFPPGTKFQYSNSNYYLLGYIIELVSGMSYQEYLRKNIFDKAGLKNTFYISEQQNGILAKGYSNIDGPIEKATLEEVTSLYAAGGLVSSAKDIYLWHKALYDGKLLSKKMLARATTPFMFPDSSLSDYAYGWFVKDINGSKTIQHSGSTDGYQSCAIYLPAENIFVVALFNCYTPSQDWEVLTTDITRIAMGSAVNQEVFISADSLQKLTGTYRYNSEHSLVVTFENGRLYIRGTNPAARLPKLPLYAEKPILFYIKEAPLKFEFVRDANNVPMIISYNSRGKDAEWKKTL